MRYFKQKNRIYLPQQINPVERDHGNLRSLNQGSETYSMITTFVV